MICFQSFLYIYNNLRILVRFFIAFAHRWKRKRIKIVIQQYLPQFIFLHLTLHIWPILAWVAFPVCSPSIAFSRKKKYTLSSSGLSLSGMRWALMNLGSEGQIIRYILIHIWMHNAINTVHFHFLLTPIWYILRTNFA